MGETIQQITEQIREHMDEFSGHIERFQTVMEAFTDEDREAVQEFLSTEIPTMLERLRATLSPEAQEAVQDLIDNAEFSISSILSGDFGFGSLGTA